MKTAVIAIAFFTAFAATAQAQEYDTGIGVNLGADMGIGFKRYKGPYEKYKGEKIRYLFDRMNDKQKTSDGANDNSL